MLRRSIALSVRTFKCSGTYVTTNPSIIQIRHLSAGDVFGKANLDTLPGLPDIPVAPLPSLSPAELVSSGQSALAEMGLFSWYTPPSYFRWALEAIHVNLDVPWWLTITLGTVVLRLLMVKVVVNAQKNAAIQAKYKSEIDAFSQRSRDARAEGNNLLAQQVLVEQQDFFRAKGIKLGRQLVTIGANSAVFLTQFFAIKKMAAASYPGFENGGMLWFSDLTACDPYYALPAISAATVFMTIKSGSEFGGTDMLSSGMKIAMRYGFPAVVLVASTQFPSAVCLYWCVSNVITLAYSGLFRINVIRNYFGILPAVKKTEPKKNLFTTFWSEYKNKKTASPSMSAVRKRDREQFHKAGRAKPIQ